MESSHTKEGVLARNMDQIIQACRDTNPDLEGIILYGGYGRDEGSWIQDAEGRWKPYNDYDICIVSPVKVPAEDLKALERSLAKAVDIRWIDLCQYSSTELSQFTPTIRNYDFRNGSKVIYGDADLLRKIPDMEAKSISMKDAEILYFTRLYTLLGSLDRFGLENDLTGETSRFFRNQMAKAILAIVDVLLLAKNAYHHSYRERVERVASLYPEKQTFHELSTWALSEKLLPQAPTMDTATATEMYADVQQHFHTEMYRGLSAHYQTPIHGPGNILAHLKHTPLQFIKRIIWIAKYRDLRMERKLNLMLAQSYIAAAWRPEGVDKDLLRKGATLLRRSGAKGDAHSDWNTLRSEAADFQTDNVR